MKKYIIFSIIKFNSLLILIAQGFLLKTHQPNHRIADIYKKYLGPDYDTTSHKNYSIVISNHYSFYVLNSMKFL